MLTCSRRRIVSCACTGVHGSCYLEWLEQPAHLVESQVHVPHASDHAVARTQKKQIGYHARRMRASATAPLHLHFVRPASAPTRAAPVTVGGAANTAGKDVRMGMSASALTRRGLRQPSHVLHGRPRAPVRHTHASCVAGVRNSSAREHLWRAAIMFMYNTASSAVVNVNVNTSLAISI